MNQSSDEELARKVQGGDAESFGFLVLRYEEKLNRYGRKFISSGEDIRDLVQEIFIKAYTNIKSFDAERKFSSWIYRIAHNEFVNAIRKKSRFPVLFSLFDFDTFLPHPFAKDLADIGANTREIKTMLDLCLGRLDPKYRETLVLHYLEEMEYQEIAEILHIPVSTVGVRLLRAKAMLKKIFLTMTAHHG
ncbi:MAG: RNA polymerase sigma factor [Candidatus Sungbacteria bacterium]|nr:RNA polymerase sigma factor [Candidatus Sungbacteria bacterium]